MLFDLRHISTSSLRQWPSTATGRRRGRLWRSRGGVSRRKVGLCLRRPVGRQRCWGGVQTAGFRVCHQGFFFFFLHRHTKLTYSPCADNETIFQTDHSLTAPNDKWNHTWSCWRKNKNGIILYFLLLSLNPIKDQSHHCIFWIPHLVYSPLVLAGDINPKYIVLFKQCIWGLFSDVD